MAALAEALPSTADPPPAPRDLPQAERETPDVETSSDRYMLRFQGATGAWLLAVQEGGVLRLLGGRAGLEGRRVLDVGGGHMQLAGPMARHGAKVTVLGSHPSCAGRWLRGGLAPMVQFLSGDLLAMPVPDQQFDVVVAIRLMAHMRDWTALVAELCRVARHSIVIDYPTLASLNALSAIAFPIKRAVETNTRCYQSFRDADIAAAFAQHGFLPVESHRQFVLPMAAHRVLGRLRVLRWMEAGLRALGVTRRFGNPVLLRLDRVKT